MGNYQPLLRNDNISHEDDVDIELPRPPMPGRQPPRVGFQPLRQGKKFPRRQRSLDPDREVQKPGLQATTMRFACIQRRYRLNPYFQRKRLHRIADSPNPVADVASQEKNRVSSSARLQFRGSTAKIRFLTPSIVSRQDIPLPFIPATRHLIYVARFSPAKPQHIGHVI